MKGDMRNITEGFTILDRYDPRGRGGVSADHDQLWAGTQDLEENDYSFFDREKLKALDWEFDTDIQRWSYYL